MSRKITKSQKMSQKKREREEPKKIFLNFEKKKFTTF